MKDLFKFILVNGKLKGCYFLALWSHPTCLEPDPHLAFPIESLTVEGYTIYGLLDVPFLKMGLLISFREYRSFRHQINFI